MNNELLSTLSIIEREKGIPREILVQAVEGALQKAARKSLGTSRDARVTIDPKTCDITVWQTLIVNDAEKGSGYIPLKAARIINPAAAVGDQIEVRAEAKDFGRIAAQTAKQALVLAIRNAEREVVYQKYLPLVGKIVNCTVKDVMRGNCICAVEGGGEGILTSKNKLPTDKLNPTQTFRALLMEVVRPGSEKESPAGAAPKDSATPGILLSRTSPEFLKALFSEQVGEIKDGSIEIVAVARDPDERRAKISVRSLDGKIDPVGACIGSRGSRIQAVQRELNGEKVDIIAWNADPRVYALNALAPAKIESVEMVSFISDRDDRRLPIPSDENARKYMLKAVVPKSGYTQAIGKRGQNVRLTVRLVGWKIVIEQKEEKTLDDQVREATEQLARELGVPVESAEKIFERGYHSPEGITNDTTEVFAAETGLDPEEAARIWNQADSVVKAKNNPPPEPVETEAGTETEAGAATETEAATEAAPEPATPAPETAPESATPEIQNP